MLKGRMSLLTMSLLAITVAATIAHAARFDTSLKTMANEPNLKSVAGGPFIPYLECIAKCDECTTCTKMWPMWRNFCVCVIHTDSKKATLQNSAVEEEVLQVKGKSEEHPGVQQTRGEAFPYGECQEKCKSVCFCAAIWPPPAYCYCSDPIQSSTSTLIKGKSEEYPGVIPYTECMETCDNCACTKKWPPESNMCFCLDASAPKKTAAVVVQQTPIAVAAKPELFPYAECDENCKVACACPLIWPPPAYCSCSDPIKSSTSTLEEATEPHTKFDLRAGPVEKGTGGGGDFIPYPECMAKCDECPVCTLPYPIEIARCLCVNHTDSASSKKSALQNPGEDDKQVVLWTKAKMETIPYKECIETCTLCACTLPWPPEFASCICVTPKPQAAAGGKALPM